MSINKIRISKKQKKNVSKIYLNFEKVIPGS